MLNNMTPTFIALIISMSLCVLAVLGDSFIKQASLKIGFTGWKWLLAGMAVYFFGSMGWFFVLRKVKLFTAGVWYAVGSVVLVTLASVFIFKEKISLLEIFAIFLAIASLVILYRFA
ncbi:MAG: hypothetical protein COT34_00325 [Candidatus Nealsonbacteria bacterium CG08_land_8_20_14_0_20_43_11]|uniref:Transporter n=1 Tax=Candidatus Nealsonbacteria bacterium CG08_land_8_20_14_0_20_43_11 TaxID=1974706 RepID=A0A2M6T188_9BACT|nr:MAG: hypothetical protein COT34_00325 [Candidatus Nealsonbacteria bacterium CG08_land_8_20_14_0_20_43_11]